MTEQNITHGWTSATAADSSDVTPDNFNNHTMIHPYPLDGYAIDATYGDDFTAASLNTTLWTRRNFTSGAETYQVGAAATYLRLDTTSRVVGDGYFQTAPSGDWTFAMAYINHYYNASTCGWGITVVDTSGNGVGIISNYSAPRAALLIKITTYTTYASVYVEQGLTGTNPNVHQWNTNTEPNDRKIWQRLRKSGTNYYFSASLDGEVWGPESDALAWTGTVDRIGMMFSPLAGAGAAGLFIDVDWFNKIA